MSNKRKVVSFYDLPIGAEFDDGVTDCIGIRQGTRMWQVYRKTDKSIAVCIAQYGYGNQRAVNGTYKFAPYRSVCYPALREN